MAAVNALHTYRGIKSRLECWSIILAQSFPGANVITHLSQTQIDSYRTNGYLIVEGLLNEMELKAWREAQREGIEHALHASRVSEMHHNQDRHDYYSNVFVQCVNLWKINAQIKQLVVDPRFGHIASQLAGVDGIRLYHDHALNKQPWANPTNWHVDNRMDPFHSREAIMLWLALDDATVQNGCLYFLPGTHKTSRYDIRDGNLDEPRIEYDSECCWCSRIERND